MGQAGSDTQEADYQSAADFQSALPMIRMLWRLTKGYRLYPWRSPYLRWRIETWSGIEASTITPGVFMSFVLANRSAFFRYLKWAARNSDGR